MAEEPDFAAAIFPAVLFDILWSDETSDSNDLIPPNRSHLIGCPSSLSNQTIARCFLQILKPEESSSDCDGSLSQHSVVSTTFAFQSDLKAVKIVTKFLDILRCVTEHRFYCSKHRLNKSEIVGRTYDCKKKSVTYDGPNQEYNNIAPSSPFYGRPYGVVIDLQDTVLASSFIRLKNYTSGLYYAENYADNTLGGSGCTFEMFPTRKIKQCGLSGFGNEIDSSKNISETERAVLFHNILKVCFSELEEEDNLIGLEEQSSRLRFETPQSFREEGYSLNSRNMGTKRFEELSLMNADTTSQIYTGRGLPFLRSRIAAVSSLSHLGLRDTVRHYLAGLSFNNECLRSSSMLEWEYIQEKWAEETWRLMQWDDTILQKHPKETINAPLSISKDMLTKAMKKSNHESLKVGYHQSLSKLLLSIWTDDRSSFTTDLYQTRLCILEEFNRNNGTKSTSRGLQSTECLKFFTLNELEDLGSVVFGETSPSTFLKKWCSGSNVFKRNNLLIYPFNDLEAAMACREIGLKIIFRKFGENADDDFGKSYLSHLQIACSFAREHSRPNLATAALERMRRFLELRRNYEDDDEMHLLRSMNISLEEARILDCMGDTTAAIRTCKLIIYSIDKLQGDVSERLCHLRGEALLQCGSWLVKHKIDAATIVLEQYLSRAAKEALNIQKKRSGEKSDSLLISSHFVLADFAANLYDSVETRVNSHEWKSLGLAAEGRRQELEEIAKMLKKCKTPPTKHNIMIQQSKLMKEVELDKQERTAVEDSIGKYLRIAIHAYGMALSRCHDIYIHSKHVFRVASLWFRNSNGTGKGGDINDLVASEVTGKIPRYV